jgi:hypothetical protein
LKVVRLWAVALLLLLAGSLLPEAQVVLIDDSAITITAPAHVDTKRTQLIQYIRGTPTLPGGNAPTVAFNVTSPVAGLGNLQRVVTLTICRLTWRMRCCSSPPDARRCRCHE